jgi:hypothetical protein
MTSESEYKRFVVASLDLGKVQGVNHFANKSIALTGGPSGAGVPTVPALHSRACMWFGAVALALVTFLSTSAVRADGSGDPAAVREVDGEYFDKEGNPTYKIQPDGTVDWYTYTGFIRCNSECIRCHGPDGEG